MVKIFGIFKFGVIASVAIAVIIIFVSAIKTKRFFSCLILSVLQGIAAFFAVNALGMVTGLHLPLNGATIAASVIGGTPGVIGLIILEVMFL